MVLVYLALVVVLRAAPVKRADGRGSTDAA
jgi:hypothetical protein